MEINTAPSIQYKTVGEVSRSDIRGNSTAVQLVTTTRDFLNLSEQWNNLLEESDHDIVCSTHEWFRCWWHGFGDGKNLFVLLAKDHGELIGIAPLMLTKGRLRGIPVRKISFMVNGHSPAANLIMARKKEEAIQAIVKYLMANKDAWDVLEFQKICAKSQSCDYLVRVLKENRISFGLEHSLRSPVISINTDWDTFFSSRSRAFRKGLRRKVKRMNALGDISTVRISDLSGIETTLPEIFEISQKSWKAKQGTSIPSNYGSLRFYREVSSVMGGKGWVDIWLLRNNGKAIAFEYHLRYKKVSYPLRADFDEDYREVSPGSVLEHNILKRLFEEGEAKEYNTCAAPYRYLMHWTENLREHITLRVFNSKMRSQLPYYWKYKAIPTFKKMGMNRLRQAIARQPGQKM